jgi:hypothetical protein
MATYTASIFNPVPKPVRDLFRLVLAAVASVIRTQEVLDLIIYGVLLTNASIWLRSRLPFVHSSSNRAPYF